MEYYDTSYESLKTFCHELPKIELHAHLHGSIRPSTLLELLENRNNCDQNDLMSLKESLTKKGNNERSLNDCFRIFKGIHEAVRTKCSLRRIVRECLDDFSQENVVYLELRSTPRCLDDSSGNGKEEYVRVVIESIKEWERNIREKCIGDEPDIMQVRLLLSIDRAGSLNDALDTVEMAHRFRCDDKNRSDPMVVGIDLGGNPTVGRGEFGKRYQPALERARKLGILISVHTAEVWDDEELKCIMNFLPERIGHLVCISEEMLKHYFMNEIAILSTIEICLTSNSMTRPELKDCNSVQNMNECYKLRKGDCQIFSNLGIHGLKQHPLRKLMKTTHPICLCTDDRGVFENSLSDEYIKAALAFNLRSEEIKEIALRAIPGIFSSELVKNTIRKNMTRKMKNLISK